jgi:exodeoxyribonuclease VII large subunit
MGSARLAIERSSPSRAVAECKRRVAELSSRLMELQRRRSSTEQGRLRTLEARLEAMSPLNVLARGYALVFRKDDGQVVRAAGQVRLGDAVQIRVAGAGCEDPDLCDQIDATVTATRRGRSSE